MVFDVLDPPSQCACEQDVSIKKRHTYSATPMSECTRAELIGGKTAEVVVPSGEAWGWGWG